MVDVELDREHYDVAVVRLLPYRQLSAGSVEVTIFPKQKRRN